MEDGEEEEEQEEEEEEEEKQDRSKLNHPPVKLGSTNTSPPSLDTPGSS